MNAERFWYLILDFSQLYTGIKINARIAPKMLASRIGFRMKKAKTIKTIKIIEVIVLRYESSFILI